MEEGNNTNEQDVVNNPMSFWSVVRRLRSTDNRTTTMTVDGGEVEGNAEIAEAFAQYFQSVYDTSALDCDQLAGAALRSALLFIQTFLPSLWVLLLIRRCCKHL
ncbi:hypothetical protein J6590_097333 [Homalodisca vitripennis]|nr:hypothetical protein J6590_097333 [Homalodisca vitripennis]